jgi:hypothetical protein
MKHIPIFAACSSCCTTTTAADLSVVSAVDAAHRHNENDMHNKIQRQQPAQLLSFIENRTQQQAENKLLKNNKASVEKYYAVILYCNKEGK